jgi:hypothetical protein
MTDDATKPAVKLSWRERLQEYGAVGVITYLVMSVLVYTGFVVAIFAGVEVEGIVGESTVWFAAWVGLKLTQPFRVAAVLALTPIIAAGWHRLRGRPIKGVPTPPSLPGQEVDTRPDP